MACRFCDKLRKCYLKQRDDGFLRRNMLDDSSDHNPLLDIICDDDCDVPVVVESATDHSSHPFIREFVQFKPPDDFKYDGDDRSELFMVTDFVPFWRSDWESVEEGDRYLEPTEALRLEYVDAFNPKYYQKVFEDLKPKAIIWQVERGADTGKLHCQMFMWFVPKKRSKQIVRYLYRRNVIKCKGGRKSVLAYHKKCETRYAGPWVLGYESFEDFELVFTPHQGSRSDLAEASEKVVKRVPMNVIAEENPNAYVRYHGGLERLQYLSLIHI